MRGALVALAGLLASAALAMALVSSPGAGAAEDGPPGPQPVLGVADLATVMMGAAGAGQPGEVWAYRRLPREVGPPVVGGRPLEFGPAAGASPSPQLAFLRHTDATGWQVVQTPVDAAGAPTRGPAPNRLSARITPGGGGLLVGRDAARTADQVVVLVRDPGGRFAEVAAPAADLLGGAGKVLAEDNGAGRVAVAAYEEAGRTQALLGALGGGTEDAVLRYDAGAAATPWTREPIVGAPAGLEILAVDATAGDNAWLLGQVGEGAPVLFERVPAGAGATWVARTIQLPAGFDSAALGGSADPLTVTSEGAWVDGTLPGATPETGFDATVFRPRGGGGAAASWCDAPGAACDRPFGARFSRDEGYTSIGFPGGGPFGRRVVSNILPLGATRDDANRGAYLSLQGAVFERTPGAGGSFRASAAFTTPTDGWLEGPVRVTGEPRPDRLRAWPVATRAPLTAAVGAPGQPAGSLDAGALAVGQEGGVIRYQAGRGWTREFLLTSSGAVSKPLLRGVAWPEPARAHAVGDLGTLWMWRAETGLWERDPATPVGFEGNLMGVAFQPGDPQRGYAVGKQGVLLRYDKTWLQETVPPGFEAVDFTQVAFAGNQAIVAAGADVLVNDGSGWRVDPGVRALFAGLPGAQPRLFAVAGLPDGGAVAAGAGVVLERDSAGGPWRFADQPLLGVTAVAVAAFRAGGRVRAVAAVQPQLDYPVPDVAPETDPSSPPPLIPPFPLAGDGYLVRETDQGWRDEQRTSYAGSGYDRPLKSDPISAFVLDANGEGWAIGGWSAEADAAGRGNSARSGTGRSDRARAQTGGIYRYAVGAPPPGSRAVTDVGTDLRGTVARFAVAGHATCEQPCTDLRSQAIAPDRMLSSALATVAGLGGQPGSPRFVLYTGGRLGPRAGALDDREAARYAGLLASGGVAAYPALSAQDSEGGTAAAFKAAFAGFPAPFGAGSAPAGTDPGGIPGAAPGPGARTHYAFDSTGANGRVRVVVIDNSRGSLAASDPYQNPPEPQAPWLQAVLADAKARGIPAVVAGSRDLNSRFRPRLNVATDADDVARLLVAGGASAYFFERPEETRTYPIPSGAAQTIPSFGTGTLGYRPALTNVTGDEPDALYSDGGFLIAEVDTRQRDAGSNRAPVRVRLQPVIDDLSIQAVDGLQLRRSRPSLFQGLGRRPVAGDRWGPAGGGGGDPQPPGGDPYTQLPPEPCVGAGCGTRVNPEYGFTSSDPDIGDFVALDPTSTNLRKPQLGADDKVITDTRSGLFCPFNAGTTTVTVKAGGLAYSTVVTVLAGSVLRPCGTRPLNPSRFTRRAPSAAPAAPPPPAPAPAPASSPPPPVPPPPPPPLAAVAPRATPRPAPPRPAPPIPAPPLEAAPSTRPQATSAVPVPPPPPAGAFARPIPPGGAVVRVVEEKREEEAAPEIESAAVAYRADDHTPLAPFLGGLAVLAAFAGATIRLGPRHHRRGAAVAVAGDRDASPARSRRRRGR